MKIELLSLKCNDTESIEVNERLTSAREALEGNYGGSDDYISDTISEIADGYTPIYNAELLKAAWVLDYYVNDGVKEGLIDVKSENFSLFSILQQAYYCMIEQDLYNSLEKIIFNYCADFVNLHCDTHEINLNEEQAENVHTMLCIIAANASYYDTFAQIDTDLREISEFLPEIPVELMNLYQEKFNKYFNRD